MEFCSIIITHFASNPERSEVFRASIKSLINSLDYPAEIIIVDNGGNIDDSHYLLDLVDCGVIHTYIRNSTNMHFGYARNQGLAVANGDYICIADNDIIYKKGWLSQCVAVLKQYPKEKIYATPVYNVAHVSQRFWIGRSLFIEGREYKLNRRAGSNCFVVRREDFEVIGGFWAHRIAGTKWTEKAIRLGYSAAICPELMIKDAGFRKGYNFKVTLPIKLTLSDKSEIYFNEDEFSHAEENKEFNYMKQRRFNETTPRIKS